MPIPKLIVAALVLASIVPARAAEPAGDSTQQQLDALKARIADLEKKAQPAPAGAPAAAPVPVGKSVLQPGGMTPEQEAEFNRIKIKAEALEDSRDANGFKGFKISGYADPTYLYNRNRDRSSFQFLVPGTREVYAYDNSYFGSVALDILKETDNGTKFHLTLVPARSAGEFIGGANVVHEATVWVPIGGTTKIFAGQLPDWSGYEMLQPTLNKLITHNLLFDTTLPYAYTGAGLEFLVGKWDLKLMVASINQTIRNPGEFRPAFVTRGDYAGGEFWGLGYAGAAGWKQNLRASVAGLETNPQTGEAYSQRDTFYGTFEVDGWYTRGPVTLNFHVTYGHQDKASITANPTTGNLRAAEWVGGSALAAYKFTPRLELALRGDYVWNQQNGGGLLDYTQSDLVTGVGPGQDPSANPSRGANRYAVSVGSGYAVNANVTWKVEYRYDGADRRVFGNKHALKDATASNAEFKFDNHVVATSMVFSF